MASLGFGKRSRRGLQLRGQQDLTGMYDEDTYDGDLDAKGWNTAAAAIQDVWLMTQTSIQIVSQSSNFGFFIALASLGKIYREGKIATVVSRFVLS